MSQVKWDKIGTVRESDKDGKKSFYIKVDKDVTLKAGEAISLFKPTSEKAPAFIKYDIVRKNNV